MTGFIGVGQLRYSMFCLLPSFCRLGCWLVRPCVWACGVVCGRACGLQEGGREGLLGLYEWELLTERVRAVLTNLGEKMSDDEVDELLKAVDTSSGEINYTGIS